MNLLIGKPPLCDSRMILSTVDAVMYCIHAKMVLDNILEKNYYPDCPSNLFFLLL